MSACQMAVGVTCSFEKVEREEGKLVQIVS